MAGLNFKGLRVVDEDRGSMEDMRLPQPEPLAPEPPPPEPPPEQRAPEPPPVRRA